MQLDLVDAAQAAEARDAALSQVAENSGSFMDRALEAIKQLPAGEYIGEDIRAALTDQNIIPHSANVWGSLTRTALSRGLITETGKLRAMRDRTSHARRSMVYRIGKEEGGSCS